MVKAPILIPTLNRENHLKRCLDSLAANSMASETDIYISVDYPPSEKYEEGYKNVCRMLEKYDFSRFQSNTIIFQKENLGPNPNCVFLKKIASEKYDRYIMTEDDNEFSINFLEYMNQCLEQFNRKDVMGVCGYKDTEWYCENNNVIASKLFSAYGFGAVFQQENDMMKKGKKEILNISNWKFSKMFSLFRKNKCLFCIYVSDIICKKDGTYWDDKGELVWCDSTRSLYLHLTDSYCIVPAISKSRTWGNDGSGVNMPLKEDYDTDVKEIDQNSHFSIENKDIKYDVKNYKIGNLYLRFPKQVKRNVKAIVKYFILCIYGYDRQKVISKLGKGSK